VHGIPLLGPAPVRLHLAERKQDRPSHHGASSTLPVEQVVEGGGRPGDLAGAHGGRRRSQSRRRCGCRRGGRGLARDVPREALEDVLLGMHRWSGVRQARTAVAFADRRSESPLESLGRWRFEEQGLTAPDLQVWLGDRFQPFARVDHHWRAQRTVAEADGALKYAGAVDLFEEKRREDRLRDAGFEVVRYTWDETLLRPQLLAARVRRAFDRAARRPAA
jgi:very-short-patch-repair endonuclease